MKCAQVLVLGMLLGTAAEAAEESAASGGLEEVVVTAQKRAQNAQDVGISLSAISGSDLQTLGAVSATDITKSVPAVVMTQPNGPSSFSLSFYSSSLCARKIYRLFSFLSVTPLN